MGTATTLSTPQDQVESLIQEVAEENGLEVMDQLKDLNPSSASIRESAEAKREDDLSRRYLHRSHVNMVKRTFKNIDPRLHGLCRLTWVDTFCCLRILPKDMQTDDSAFL